MAIGSAQVTLADRGLVLVQGENPDESSADSNGAGKSSIFDAVSWALYGLTARGEDGDKVVNRTAGKDCVVSVEIEDGLNTYVIGRHRKHKTGKNGLIVFQTAMVTAGMQVQTPGSDLSKGTDKLTQEVVNQIVGCSHEVFVGAVYAAQEKFPDLPGMTDKQLKMMIEEASGATLLEAAYQEANKALRTKESELALSHSKKDNLERQVTNGRDQIASGKATSEKFEQERGRAVRELHQRALAAKGLVLTYKAGLAKLGDKPTIEGRILQLEVLIDAVDKELDEARKFSDIASMAEHNSRSAEIEVRNLRRQVAAKSQQLSALDHQVGCPCSTCDRAFSAEDIEPAKKLAAAELAKVESETNAAETKMDAALIAFKKAQSRRDAYRASMTDLSKTNAERSSLQTQLTGIERQEAVVEGKRQEIISLVEQIEAKKKEANPFIPQIAQYEKMVKRWEEELTEAVTALEGTTLSVKVAESVAKVFSPAGVRAFLLDEVTPFLNDQTAKYLGTLSDGHISATWTTLVKTAKNELREKFSIEVTTTTGGETFKSISGGEKRKVRIACALALQDLVARRASKPIELFIGDEIDDALDDAGRERLMSILEEKAKDRGSVFVISHSDLKDWIRNHITVTKTGGKSTVTEAMA
jgi:DNA repair exonuclease SbcCD ATPase subunit